MLLSLPTSSCVSLRSVSALSMFAGFHQLLRLGLVFCVSCANAMRIVLCICVVGNTRNCRLLLGLLPVACTPMHAAAIQQCADFKLALCRESNDERASSNGRKTTNSNFICSARISMLTDTEIFARILFAFRPMTKLIDNSQIVSRTEIFRVFVFLFVCDL